jgi:hypothetical protein
MNLPSAGSAFKSPRSARSPMSPDRSALSPRVVLDVALNSPLNSPIASRLSLSNKRGNEDEDFGNT